MPSRTPAGSPDLQQTLRLRRFLLASPLYLVAIPLLVWTRQLELMDAGDMALVLLSIALINTVFLFLFRTGLNRRFRDPSLTWPQMLAGTVLLFFVIYAMRGERSIALVLCPVLLLFGVFRFSTREFVLAALIMVGGYALVIVVLALQGAPRADTMLAWYRWAVLACVLGVFARVGGKSSELRQNLRRTNESLRSAMGTIQRMATHDALTGLPNRTLLNETLVHALATAARHHWRAALLFIDLDRFKIINDTLGHEAGDRVLQEIARRLGASAGTDHMVARLGGDEFVLVMDEIEGGEEADAMARRITEGLAVPLVIDGRELLVAASVGVSIFPIDAGDAQSLLSHADIAMYRVKEQGGNGVCHFSSRLASRSVGRLAIEGSLRRALERQELLLHYQPKIEIASGRVTGVEALLRWQHPELGLLSPSRFIHVAEETGLIVPIGIWVLEQACSRAKAWSAAGLGVPIAVNLSARQFHDRELIASTAAVLARTGLPAHMLELEITESMTMRDPDQACAIMRSLRELGMRLTLDDFGTGYSSLGYLKRFPVDALKLDRSFVADLPHAMSDVAITRAVIAMARTLGITVIAEGVERAAQLECLRQERCDEYQGFLCQAPLPEIELLEFLRGWQERRSFAAAARELAAGVGPSRGPGWGTLQ
ncbi:MAG: EAL domain-containing protein [Casimicrobiaceae bacterium]